MDGQMVTKFGVCLRDTLARADVPLFRILDTAGRIVLKFGVCLETYEQGFLQ